MHIKNFFSTAQQKIIVQAIADAEKNTSGEIRVHIDKKCKGEVLDVAADFFKSMKMHETALRNGVLFYLSIEDQKFAILGDKGIHEKVPNNFWDEIRDTMLHHFKQKDFTEGLQKGIEMAGEKLKFHFPIQSNDTNELSNDISFGKDE
jgi:uncharacterized membrane protein